MNGFEKPPGEPGAVKAGELGALGGDVKTQEHALVSGFASALTNAAALLQAFCTALHQAREDIAGLERQAHQRQSAAEASVAGMDPNDAEIDRTSQQAPAWTSRSGTPFAADFNLVKALDSAGEGGLAGFMAGASHVMAALGVVGDVCTVGGWLGL